MSAKAHIRSGWFQATTEYPASIAGERFGLERGIERRSEESRRASAEQEAGGCPDVAQIMPHPVEGVELAGHEAWSHPGIETHRRRDRVRNRQCGCWRGIASRGERHDGDAAADNGHDHHRAGLDAFVAAGRGFMGEKVDVIQNVAPPRQRRRLRRPIGRRRFPRRWAGQLQGRPFAHRS